MKKVTDRADDLTYTGAMDFKDGADKAVEYAYDANGNMTSDLNRGIVSITYNQLNLPQSVLFKDGHESRYTYAADGRKLRAEYRLNNFQIIDKSDASGSDWAEQSTIGDGMVVKPGITDSVKADNPYYTTLTVRDYCGSYIYKNGKLERVLTDNGYWQDGELYFYIKDYQGNVRVVLDQRNHPVELNAYYPYGMLMAATPSDSKQPHKYGAKELDRENALDLYDSQAQWYAPQTGRTPTMDPLAEKYPHLSPYLWCAANPNRFIDEKGDSIAVLYLHGIVGHLALLIQNDNGKWAYYSMNGNNIYTSTKGSAGGKGYHDLGTKTFDSPMAFLNSSYNQEGKNKRDIQNDKVNNYGYEEAFVIPTTQKQDKKIREKFLSETHQSYNLVNRQCAQVVQKALNAAGIETNSSEMSYYDDMFLPDSTPYLPARTFIAIRYNNPKGIYIRKK